MDEDFEMTEEDLEVQREFDEYLKECEELNPGSTGYTSNFD